MRVRELLSERHERGEGGGKEAGGVPPGRVSTAVDGKGRSALWFAAKGGHTGVVRVVLEVAARDLTGIEIDIREPREDGGESAGGAGGASERPTAAEDAARLPAALDGYIGPALAAAAGSGKDDVVRYLLRVGSDAARVTDRAVDARGCSALWLAAARGHGGCVAALLPAVGDVNSPPPPSVREAGSGTPFWSACWFGALEVVLLLLADERVDVTGDASHRGDGLDPVMAAAMRGHTDVLRALLGSARMDGVVRGGVDENGRTALYAAARAGQLEAVAALAEDARVDVDAANGDGESPLHVACWTGQVDCVRYLLDAHGDAIDVNKASTWGASPLYAAAREGHVAIVELLLANPSVDTRQADKVRTVSLHALFDASLHDSPSPAWPHPS